MPETAIRLRIEGRVQGVGFRAWTARTAQRLRVRGWVRNRGDGSVEALLIGEADAVAAMIEACRRGPALARVDAVASTPAEDDGSRAFDERPSA